MAQKRRPDGVPGALETKKYRRQGIPCRRHHAVRAPQSAFGARRKWVLPSGSAGAGAHQPQSQTAQGPNAKAAPDGRATQTGAFDTVATSAFQDQTGESPSILNNITPQPSVENNQNPAQTAAENPVQTSDAARAVLNAVDGQKNTADATTAVNENGLISLSKLEQTIFPAESEIRSYPRSGMRPHLFEMHFPTSRAMIGRTLEKYQMQQHKWLWIKQAWTSADTMQFCPATPFGICSKTMAMQNQKRPGGKSL